MRISLPSPCLEVVAANRHKITPATRNSLHGRVRCFMFTFNRLSTRLVLWPELTRFSPLQGGLQEEICGTIE